MESKKEERILVKKIIDGDEEVLTQFIQEYGPHLFSFIFHQVDGNREDAEDLWQDTLIVVLNSLPAFRGESRLFTWMCAIARLKTAGYYRQIGRQPREESLSISTDQAGHLLDQNPLPDTVINQREVRCRVVETLQEMPADYRQALLARYLEGQSVGDLAVILGRSYKAAESLLSRARICFQEMFSKSGGQHEG